MPSRDQPTTAHAPAGVPKVPSAAAGSFRRERDNGVLQLLLVSPLKIEEIIAGRVRGLLGQFLPAMLLLMGVWLYTGREFLVAYPWAGDRSTADARMFFYISTYFTIPVVGLYCSLRERSYVTALLVTITFGLIVPILVGLIVNLLGSLFERGGFEFSTAALFALMAQVFIAALCGINLHNRLTRRQFAFAHTST